MSNWRDDLHAVRVKYEPPLTDPILGPDGKPPDFIWQWTRFFTTVQTAQHPNDMDDETLLGYVRAADTAGARSNRDRVPQGDPLAGGAPYLG